MSYLSDTVVTAKPTGALDPSQTVYGQVAYLAPDPPDPDFYINVRLSNGSGYYTAGLACIVLIIVSFVFMLALRYITNRRSH